VTFQCIESEGKVVAINLPEPPTDSRGHACIFNAGISDEVGHLQSSSGSNSSFSIDANAISTEWSEDCVPIIRLEDVLLVWVEGIFFLKLIPKVLN